MNELKDLFKDIKIDNAAVEKYEKQYQDNVIFQRQLFLKNTTPEEYRTANMKSINEKIQSFCNNDKIFCWIFGVKGVGKTYALYAIRNYQIITKGNIYFDIRMEGELNYDIDFKKINAVDNLCISDSKMKFLADYYFNLIDWKWKTHQKLILTSTKTHEEWLNLLSKYNNESAEAISSRFSNRIDVIELAGNDRRKIK